MTHHERSSARGQESTRWTNIAGGRGHLRVLTILSSVALAIPACTLQGAFVEDQRVEIVRPQDRAEVELPLAVQWTAEDFVITPPDGSASDDRGYFAILIDRAPMPPGEDLESLAEGDLECQENPKCPDRRWFASHGVYYTTATSFEIENLVDSRPEERPEAPDRHEVTIVLLNGRGERIGETAFSVEFDINRKQVS